MSILVTLFLIYIITILAWFLNKILPFRVCPICAGVSGVWIAMLFAKFLGYSVNDTILAMLMGGSVAGIAYQLEKHLPKNRSSLLWKSLFIPAGFLAAYALIAYLWIFFFLSLLSLLLIIIIFFKPSHKEKENKKIKELEEKMKHCC